MRRCPKCHKIIDDNVNLCEHCGAELDMMENDDDDELFEDFLIIELTDEDEEFDEGL
jgi:hypothetical protein